MRLSWVPCVAIGVCCICAAASPTERAGEVELAGGGRASTGRGVIGEVELAGGDFLHGSGCRCLPSLRKSRVARVPAAFFSLCPPRRASSPVCKAATWSSWKNTGGDLLVRPVRSRAAGRASRARRLLSLQTFLEPSFAFLQTAHGSSPSVRQVGRCAGTLRFFFAVVFGDFVGVRFGGMGATSLHVQSL